MLVDGVPGPPFAKDKIWEAEKREYTGMAVLLADFLLLEGRSGYNRLSRNTLKELARSRGVKIDVSMSKKDLIGKLLAGEESKLASEEQQGPSASL